MNKLEFGDVNKFLTSLGLIFIALSFALPWFFTQQNTLLTIKESDLKSFTLQAQEVLISQQNLLLQISKHILIISILLFIVGILVLIVGIVRWWRRQNVIDEIQDEDLVFKKMQNFSWLEKRETIEEELNNLGEEIQPLEIKTAIDNYIEIENIVFSNISLNYSNNYQIFQNVKIENSEFDVVLRSIAPSTISDKVIEIKYYNNDLVLSNLQSALYDLIKNCKIYTQTLKKRCAGVLLIIYNSDELPDKLLRFRINLQKIGKENGINLRVQFIKKETIRNGNKIELFK